MNRKALIISNPGELGDMHYCKGVFKDVENYRNFLLSPIGGLWTSSEIENLHKPSLLKVRNCLSGLSGYGYVFIVFTGHGWYSKERGSTILQLSKGQDFDSAELRRGALKQTVILDCCREIHTSALLSKMVLENAKIALKIHPDRCRRYYDQRIVECENGLVMLYSCSRGEVSGDDSERGGYYSYNLIEDVRRVANYVDIDTNNGNYSICSVVQAHEQTEESVSKISGGRQHPQIEKPRTDKHCFPFCIVA